MSDQYGLNSQFSFSTEGNSLEQMGVVISQLESLDQAARQAARSVKSSGLAGSLEAVGKAGTEGLGETAQSLRGVSASASKVAKDGLVPLRAEFRALRAESRLIDFGEITDTDQFKAATREVGRYVEGLKKLENQVGQGTAAEREFNAVLKNQQALGENRVKMSEEQRKAVIASEKVGLASGFRNVGKSIANALSGPQEAASELQQHVGAIGKLVGESLDGEGLRRVQNDILNYSAKYAKGADSVAVAYENLAGAARDFKKVGADSVKNEVDQILMNATALDVSEQAATDLDITLGRVYKNSMGRYGGLVAMNRKVGSVVNVLTDKLDDVAISADGVMPIITELVSGIGDKKNFGIDKIAAFAAALNNAQIAPSESAAFVNRLSSTMGGQSQVYAKTLGQSKTQFKDKLNTDKLGVIEDVIKGYKKLEGDEISQANYFKKLGIVSSQDKAIIQKLATSIGVLDQALALSAAELKNGKSIQEEWNRVQQQSAFQQAKVKRGMDALKLAFGLAINEALLPVMQVFGNVLGVLILLTQKFPLLTKIVAVGTLVFGALAATIGTVAVALFAWQQAAATSALASVALQRSIVPLTGFYEATLLAFQGTNPLVSSLRLLQRGASTTSASLWGMLAPMRMVGAASYAFLVSPMGLVIVTLAGMLALFQAAIPGINLLGLGLGGLAAIFGGLMGFIKGFGRGFLKAFAPLGAAVDSILTPFKGFAAYIQGSIKMALAAFKLFFAAGDQFGEKLGAALGGFDKMVFDFMVAPILWAAGRIAALWGGMVQTIRSLLQPLVPFAAMIGGLLVHNLAENSPGPTSRIRSLWEHTTEFIQGALHSMVAVAMWAGSAMGHAFTGGATLARTVFDNLKNAAVSAPGQIGAAFSSVGGLIRNAFGSSKTFLFAAQQRLQTSLSANVPVSATAGKDGEAAAQGAMPGLGGQAAKVFSPLQAAIGGIAGNVGKALLPNAQAKSAMALGGDFSYAKSDDQVNEILAKKIAYINPKTLTDPDQNDPVAQNALKFLADHSLKIEKVMDDQKTGFQALGLTSTDGGASKLLIRGTNDLQDVIDDLTGQVGDKQFSANADSIGSFLSQELARTGNKSEVVGHSLGAAIAQETAAQFSPLLSKVTTFNTPGIDQATVSQFQQAAQDLGSAAPQIKHFLTKGDIVSTGGEAFLPGQASISDTHDAPNLLNPLTAHLGLTLDGSEGIEQSALSMGELSSQMYSAGLMSRFISEPLREMTSVLLAFVGGLGVAVAGVVGLLASLPQQVQGLLGLFGSLEAKLNQSPLAKGDLFGMMGSGLAQVGSGIEAYKQRVAPALSLGGDFGYAQSDDQINEVLSKKVAYVDPQELLNTDGSGSQAVKDAQAFLKEHNLQIESIIENAQTGFAAIGLKDLAGGASKMVIRGTQFAKGDTGDLYNDLLPSASVGENQFEGNAGDIRAFLEQQYLETGKKSQIMGHSLGGAIAQLAGTKFAPLASEIETFNSPGVNQSVVKEYQNFTGAVGEAPAVKHFVKKGDIVSSAGEAFLPGQATMVADNKSGFAAQFMDPANVLIHHNELMLDTAKQYDQTALSVDDLNSGFFRAGPLVRGMSEPMRRIVGVAAAGVLAFSNFVKAVLRFPAAFQAFIQNDPIGQIKAGLIALPSLALAVGAALALGLGTMAGRAVEGASRLLAGLGEEAQQLWSQFSEAQPQLASMLSGAVGKAGEFFGGAPAIAAELPATEATDGFAQRMQSLLQPGDGAPTDAILAGFGLVEAQADETAQHSTKAQQLWSQFSEAQPQLASMLSGAVGKAGEFFGGAPAIAAELPATEATDGFAQRMQSLLQPGDGAPTDAILAGFGLVEAQADETAQHSTSAWDGFTQKLQNVHPWAFISTYIQGHTVLWSKAFTDVQAALGGMFAPATAWLGGFGDEVQAVIGFLTQVVTNPLGAIDTVLQGVLNHLDVVSAVLLLLSAGPLAFVQSGAIKKGLAKAFAYALPAITAGLVALGVPDLLGDVIGGAGSAIAKAIKGVFGALGIPQQFGDALFGGIPQQATDAIADTGNQIQTFVKAVPPLQFLFELGVAQSLFAAVLELERTIGLGMILKSIFDSVGASIKLLVSALRPLAEAVMPRLNAGMGALSQKLMGVLTKLPGLSGLGAAVPEVAGLGGVAMTGLKGLGAAAKDGSDVLLGEILHQEMNAESLAAQITENTMKALPLLGKIVQGIWRAGKSPYDLGKRAAAMPGGQQVKKGAGLLAVLGIKKSKQAVGGTVSGIAHFPELLQRLTEGTSDLTPLDLMGTPIAKARKRQKIAGKYGLSERAYSQVEQDRRETKGGIAKGMMGLEDIISGRLLFFLRPYVEMIGFAAAGFLVLNTVLKAINPDWDLLNIMVSWTSRSFDRLGATFTKVKPVIDGIVRAIQYAFLEIGDAVSDSPDWVSSLATSLSGLAFILKNLFSSDLNFEVPNFAEALGAQTKAQFGNGFGFLTQPETLPPSQAAQMGPFPEGAGMIPVTTALPIGPQVPESSRFKPEVAAQLTSDFDKRVTGVDQSAQVQKFRELMDLEGERNINSFQKRFHRNVDPSEAEMLKKGAYAGKGGGETMQKAAGKAGLSGFTPEQLQQFQSKKGIAELLKTLPDMTKAKADAAALGVPEWAVVTVRNLKMVAGWITTVFNKFKDVSNWFIEKFNLGDKIAQAGSAIKELSSYFIDIIPIILLAVTAFGLIQGKPLKGFKMLLGGTTKALGFLMGGLMQLPKLLLKGAMGFAKFAFNKGRETLTGRKHQVNAAVPEGGEAKPNQESFADVFKQGIADQVRAKGGITTDVDARQQAEALEKTNQVVQFRKTMDGQIAQAMKRRKGEMEGVRQKSILGLFNVKQRFFTDEQKQGIRSDVLNKSKNIRAAAQESGLTGFKDDQLKNLMTKEGIQKLIKTDILGKELQTINAQNVNLNADAVSATAQNLNSNVRSGADFNADQVNIYGNKSFADVVTDFAEAKRKRDSVVSAITDTGLKKRGVPDDIAAKYGGRPFQELKLAELTELADALKLAPPKTAMVRQGKEKKPIESFGQLADLKDLNLLAAIKHGGFGFSAGDLTDLVASGSIPIHPQQEKSAARMIKGEDTLGIPMAKLSEEQSNRNREQLLASLVRGQLQDKLTEQALPAQLGDRTKQKLDDPLARAKLSGYATMSTAQVREQYPTPPEISAFAAELGVKLSDLGDTYDAVLGQVVEHQKLIQQALGQVDQSNVALNKGMNGVETPKSLAGFIGHKFKQFRAARAEKTVAGQAAKAAQQKEQEEMNLRAARVQKIRDMAQATGQSPAGLLMNGNLLADYSAANSKIFTGAPEQGGGDFTKLYEGADPATKAEKTMESLRAIARAGGVSMGELVTPTRTFDQSQINQAVQLRTKRMDDRLMEQGNLRRKKKQEPGITSFEGLQSMDLSMVGQSMSNQDMLNLQYGKFHKLNEEKVAQIANELGLTMAELETQFSTHTLLPKDEPVTGGAEGKKGILGKLKAFLPGRKKQPDYGQDLESAQAGLARQVALDQIAQRDKVAQRYTATDERITAHGFDLEKFLKDQKINRTAEGVKQHIAENSFGKLEGFSPGQATALAAGIGLPTATAMSEVADFKKHPIPKEALQARQAQLQQLQQQQQAQEIANIPYLQPDEVGMQIQKEGYGNLSDVDRRDLTGGSESMYVPLMDSARQLQQIGQTAKDKLQSKVAAVKQAYDGATAATAKGIVTLREYGNALKQAPQKLKSLQDAPRRFYEDYIGRQKYSLNTLMKRVGANNLDDLRTKLQSMPDLSEDVFENLVGGSQQKLRRMLSSGGHNFDQIESLLKGPEEDLRSALKTATDKRALSAGGMLPERIEELYNLPNAASEVPKVLGQLSGKHRPKYDYENLVQSVKGTGSRVQGVLKQSGLDEKKIQALMKGPQRQLEQALQRAYMGQAKAVMAEATGKNMAGFELEPLLQSAGGDRKDVMAHLSSSGVSDDDIKSYVGQLRAIALQQQQAGDLAGGINGRRPDVAKLVGRENFEFLSAFFGVDPKEFKKSFTTEEFEPYQVHAAKKVGGMIGGGAKRVAGGAANLAGKAIGGAAQFGGQKLGAMGVRVAAKYAPDAMKQLKEYSQELGHSAGDVVGSLRKYFPASKQLSNLEAWFRKSGQSTGAFFDQQIDALKASKLAADERRKAFAAKKAALINNLLESWQALTKVPQQIIDGVKQGIERAKQSQRLSQLWGSIKGTFASIGAAVKKTLKGAASAISSASRSSIGSGMTGRFSRFYGKPKPFVEASPTPSAPSPVTKTQPPNMDMLAKLALSGLRSDDSQAKRSLWEPSGQAYAKEQTLKTMQDHGVNFQDVMEHLQRQSQQADQPDAQRLAQQQLSQFQDLFGVQQPSMLPPGGAAAAAPASRSRGSQPERLPERGALVTPPTNSAVGFKLIRFFEGMANKVSQVGSSVAGGLEQKAKAIERPTIAGTEKLAWKRRTYSEDKETGKGRWDRTDYTPLGKRKETEVESTPIKAIAMEQAAKAARGTSLKISNYFAASAERTQSAWGESATAITQKNWIGMVRRAVWTGSNIVLHMNHGAADVTAAAWERTEDQFDDVTRHMTQTAKHAGAEMGAAMGGAATHTAEQMEEMQAAHAAKQTHGQVPPRRHGMVRRGMGAIGKGAKFAAMGGGMGMAGIGAIGMAAGDLASSGEMLGMSEEASKTLMMVSQGGMVLASLMGLFNPAVLVIAGVAAALAGLALAWRNDFMGIREATAFAATGIKLYFDFIVGFVSAEVRFIGGLLSGLQAGVLKGLTWVQTFLSGFGVQLPFLDNLINGVTRLPEIFGMAIDWLRGKWQGFTTWFSENIWTMVQPALDVAQGLINALNHNPTVAIPNAWDNAIESIKGYLGILPGFANWVSGQLNTILNPENAFKSLKDWFTGIGGWLKKLPGMGKIFDGLESFLNSFGQKSGQAGTVIESAVFDYSKELLSAVKLAQVTEGTNSEAYQTLKSVLDQTGGQLTPDQLSGVYQATGGNYIQGVVTAENVAAQETVEREVFINASLQLADTALTDTGGQIQQTFDYFSDEIRSRWSYIQETQGQDIGSLFRPGLETMKAGFGRLAGDAQNFAFRAGKALLTFNFKELVASTNDFGNNFMAAAGMVLTGFDSMQASAIIYGLWSLASFSPTLVILGAIAIAAVMVYTNFLGIRSILAGVFDIAIGVLQIINAVARGTGQVLQGVVMMLSGIGAALRGDFTLIQAGATRVWQGIRTMAVGVWAGLERIWLGIKGLFVGVGQALLQVFDLIVNRILGRIGFVKQAFHGISAVVNFVGSAIVLALTEPEKIWQAFTNAIVNGRTTIGNALSQVGASVRWLGQTFGMILTSPMQAWGRLKTLLDEIWDRLKSMVQKVTDTAAGVGDALNNIIPGRKKKKQGEADTAGQVPVDVAPNQAMGEVGGNLLPPEAKKKGGWRRPGWLGGETQPAPIVEAEGAAPVAPARKPSWAERRQVELERIKAQHQARIDAIADQAPGAEDRKAAAFESIREQQKTRLGELTAPKQRTGWFGRKQSEPAMVADVIPAVVDEPPIVAAATIPQKKGWSRPAWFGGKKQVEPVVEAAATLPETAEAPTTPIVAAETAPRKKRWSRPIWAGGKKPVESVVEAAATIPTPVDEPPPIVNTGAIPPPKPTDDGEETKSVKAFRAGKQAIDSLATSVGSLSPALAAPLYAMSGLAQAVDSFGSVMEATSTLVKVVNPSLVTMGATATVVSAQEATAAGVAGAASVSQAAVTTTANTAMSGSFVEAGVASTLADTAITVGAAEAGTAQTVAGGLIAGINTAIAAGFTWVATTATAAWTTITVGVAKAGGMMGIGATIMNTASGYISTGFAAVTGFATAAWTTITTGATAAATRMGISGTLMNAIAGYISTGFAAVTGFATTAWTTITTGAIGSATGMGIGGTLMTAIAGYISTGFAAITGFATTAWTTITTGAIGAAAGMGIGGTLMNVIAGYISTGFAAITAVATAAWTTVTTGAIGAATGMGIGAAFMGTIGTFLSTVFTAIGTAASVAWTSVLAPFAPIIIGVLAVAAVLGGLYFAFKNNFLGIGDSFSGLMNSFKGLGKALEPLWNLFKGGFMLAIGLALTPLILALKVVAFLIQVVVNGITGIINGFMAVGSAIGQFLLDPFKFVASFVQTLFGWITQAISNMPLVGPLLSALGSALGIGGGGGQGESEQPVQAFASGGLVKGPGTSTGDRVMAAVSPGEFVINAAATRENYGLLDSINDGQYSGDLTAQSMPLPPIYMGGTPGVTAAASSESAPAGLPPISVQLTFGDIVISGGTGPEMAMEFLDQIEPHLQRRIRDLLRNLVETMR